MSYSRKGSPIVTILLTGAVITYWKYVQYVLAVMVACLVLRTMYRLYVFFRLSFQDFRLKDVDVMSGIAFEDFVAQALRSQGYTSVSLTEKYDYGVDIIAHKDGIKWGVQVKRYNGLVKADAVRQVVTGLKVYGCDRSMVITNNYYSKPAKILARANDCRLLDRNNLKQLLG